MLIDYSKLSNFYLGILKSKNGRGIPRSQNILVVIKSESIEEAANALHGTLNNESAFIKDIKERYPKINIKNLDVMIVDLIEMGEYKEQLIDGSMCIYDTENSLTFK